MGRKGADDENVKKAREWSKKVDETEKKINEANKSKASADEKLRKLLEDDS